MVSSDDVLAPYILDWIHSEDFEKVPEAIHHDVAVLESVSKSDR